jgi:hypothetical protein
MNEYYAKFRVTIERVGDDDRMIELERTDSYFAFTKEGEVLLRKLNEIKDEANTQMQKMRERFAFLFFVFFLFPLILIFYLTARFQPISGPHAGLIFVCIILVITLISACFGLQRTEKQIQKLFHDNPDNEIAAFLLERHPDFHTALKEVNPKLAEICSVFLPGTPAESIF